MNALGLLTGLGGLVTVLPPLGDVAGAVFGLSAIAWFIGVGVTLMRRGGAAAADIGGRAA